MTVKQVSFMIFCLCAVIQISFTMAISATAQPIQAQEQPQQPQRPQTPKPKFPYKEREITFTNPKDGTKLVGTLAMPFGRGKYAAVILLPGSGPQDRDQTLAGHKPALVISNHLLLQ
jgi:hypothetical protein